MYPLASDRGMATVDDGIQRLCLASRNVQVPTPQLVKITDFGVTRITDVREAHCKATGGMVRWEGQG